MTKHTFLEGMGLGILAGTAIWMAVAVKRPEMVRDMRRAAHRAGRTVEHIKDDLADGMGL